MTKDEKIKMIGGAAISELKEVSKGNEELFTNMCILLSKINLVFFLSSISLYESYAPDVLRTLANAIDLLQKVSKEKD